MKRASIFTFALLLLLTRFTHATTVERLSLDEMVKKSHRIVVGKVTGERTHWSANGRLILTTYTIEVQETMKGRSSHTTEVTTIGGRIGNRQLHVAGMPAFEKGEDTVLFIEDTGIASTVVGLGQGKFSITNGEVANFVGELSFPDGNPGRPLKMPLESFKKQIKILVGR